MYRVEMYARVRRACRVEGMSTREASRVFGLDRKTVRKMLSFSVPPGYRRSMPRRRPKLDAFTGIIDRILENDRTSPASSATRPSVSSTGFAPSTGSAAATRSKPCENSGGGGDGGLGNHDLRRSRVIWRFGAGSPVEGAPGLRGSMCGARFWPDSRLMPSRRRSRREHLPERSRGGCCKPAP